MKKKNFKMFLILGLVLFLSIGYAVVNSVTLTITGSAGAGSEEMDVVISEINSISDTSKATAKINADNKSSTIEVKNMVLNEPITIKYNLRNNETDVGGRISVGEITNTNSEHFKVEVTWENTSYTPICAGEDFFYPISVIVTMIKTPIEETNSSATIGVTLNATPSSDITSNDCK